MTPCTNQRSVQRSPQRTRMSPRDCCRGMSLKIVFSSPNRLRSGFSFKERLPREMDSMLLYKFTCGTCNCTYIGETKRHFQVRSHEHMGISLLTNKPLTYNANNATGIKKHCHELEHHSNIDDFQIVGHASNKFHLRMKESWQNWKNHLSSMFKKSRFHCASLVEWCVCVWWYGILFILLCSCCCLVSIWLINCSFVIVIG